MSACASCGAPDPVGYMTAVWRQSWRSDPVGRAIADRHYNRQSIGADGFVPPGRCVVFLADTPALWVTSWPFAEFVRHEWPGAWINSCFRKEGSGLASEMIREAIAVTRWEWWPHVPELGMVSFVDPSKVEHKRQPGRCYLKAGFRLVGRTKGGLLAFQMLPDEMPEPLEPQPKEGALIATLTTAGLKTGTVLRGRQKRDPIDEPTKDGINERPLQEALFA
jgi:hypothetical protein